ncbi:hypothetical protein AH156_19970 [Salmonella enterica subsp. enterica serovar Enteritidis]|nr:hypothetical protein [Salmonella enterica subsp. enterica serovar Enteritidis]
MALLTPEAAQAIEWLRVRIPDRHWDQFRDEMETAMSTVLKRYGFDKELVEGFDVARIIARRVPLRPAEQPQQFVNVRVTVYTGEVGVFAVDEMGGVWERNGEGAWLSCNMSPQQVKKASTTYSHEMIKVRSETL